MLLIRSQVDDQPPIFLFFLVGEGGALTGTGADDVHCGPLRCTAGRGSDRQGGWTCWRIGFDDLNFQSLLGLCVIFFFFFFLARTRPADSPRRERPACCVRALCIIYLAQFARQTQHNTPTDVALFLLFFLSFPPLPSLS